MGDRDGQKPTPVTNGHRPANDNPSIPEVRQPSVALPGIVKPKGTPKAAGNRLPPPTRPRAARLVSAPRVAQSPHTGHAADFDEATLVDATKVMAPPPPPEPFTPPRRRPEAERTQIVIPLPPPDLGPRSRSSSPALTDTDPLAQTAGEIVCGRGRAASKGAPRAAVVVAGARRRQVAVGVLGLAVIAAIAGTAIGFSSSSVPPVVVPVPVPVMMRPERATRSEPPTEPAPRRPIVEELPVAARAPEPAPPAPPEPASEPDEIAPPYVERMPVARPMRQRTIAPSSSVGVRHKTHPAKASKQARSAHALSYDPDALFLKRP